MACGNRLQAQILGNAPCGHFKYKYPKEVRKEGFIGAKVNFEYPAVGLSFQTTFFPSKVFFFSAHVMGFNTEGLDESDEFKDFQWLTQEELKGSLGKSYYQAVSKFILPDD